MPATLAQSPLWSTSTIGSANAHLVEREGGALHHRLCNMASNEIRSNLHRTKSGDKQKLEEPKWRTQRPECFTPHLKRSVCTEWG